MEDKNTYIVYIQRSEAEGIVSVCSTTDLSKAKEIESHWKAICKVSLQTIPYPKSLELVDPPNYESLKFKSLEQEVKNYQTAIDSVKGFCKHYLIGRMEAMMVLSHHLYGKEIVKGYKMQNYKL